MKLLFQNHFVRLAVILMIYTLPGFGESGATVASKWDRAGSLAVALFRAPVPERIRIKEEMFSILTCEETGYPVVFVDMDAAGRNDGTSWENACTDLQNGIRVLSDAGLEGWVWVAEGSYSSDENPNCSIHLSGRVMLFGGFSGIETLLRQRNPDRFPTIIHGNASKRYGKRAVDMEHETLIDGFIIRDSGYKNDGEGSWGGRLSDENQGGGIRTLNTFSIIRNNRITENHARGGGGIFVWNRDTLSPARTHLVAPVIENNIIHHNYGKCGAGVQIRNSEVLFCNNIVADNCHIPLIGELDHSKGLEILLDLSLSDPPVVCNSVIWNNTGNGTFPDLYNHVRNAADAKAISIHNCIRRGGYGEELLTGDPLFTGQMSSDYSYQSGSSCINTGYPDSFQDPDGSRIDTGVFQADRYMLTINPCCPCRVSSWGWYYMGERTVIDTDSIMNVPDHEVRYLFRSWQGEGSGSYSGENRTAEIVVEGTITQTLLCRQQFRILTSVMPDSGGLIHMEPPAVWLDAGSAVSLTAYPAMDLFQWEGWSGDITGSDNPVCFRLDSTVTVTAHFIRKTCFRALQQVPAAFELYPNAPNPFNSSTYIAYSIPADAPVFLAVYNLQGCCMACLVDEIQATGFYRIEFEARALETSVYFILLQTDKNKVVRKIIVLK